MNFINRIQQTTWGRKTLFFLLVGFSTIMVFCTLGLEGTHGALTYHGNRYYEGFSFTNVYWRSFLLFLGAYFLLLLPWFIYCFAPKTHYQSISIFPVKPNHSAGIGILLTLWSAFTGGLFSFTYCYYTWVGYSKHIIILDDEYPIILMAYFFCIIFWGIVDFIYWIYFWRKRPCKTSMVNAF